MQTVACYGQQNTADPDDPTKKTMRYFVKGAYAYNRITNSNITRWSEVMRSLRTRDGSKKHMVRFDVCGDTAFSFYCPNPLQAWKNLARKFPANMRPVWDPNII